MKKVARLRNPQDEFMPPIKTPVEPNVGVRTTGRIKKPKAVFDPSDNYVPRAQRANQVNTQQQPVTSPKTGSVVSAQKAAVQASSPPTAVASREKQRERSLSTGSNSSSSQETDVCKVCQKREPRRGGNYKNKLLTCNNCSQKVHRWCFSTDFLDSAPVRQNFKCATCRKCYTCDSSKQNLKISGDLATCAKCLASYHVACHSPKITKQQQTQRNWKCSKCLPSVMPAAVSDSNTSKEEALSDTVIRQIIGYDTNMKPLPPKRASPKPEQPPKELPPEQNEQKERKLKSPECNNSVESTVETQVKAERRSHLEITSSSSSEDEASDDEDYKYVEKKKRRLLPESDTNGNNNNGVVKSNGNQNDNGDEHANGGEDGTEVEDNLEINLRPERKTSFNTFTEAIEDLPKREVVRTWSVEKLSNYVQKYFPNEAQVFKEHEIDGNALLLLKRSDVIQKLPLKLGPSLRLYNFILKIQTQKPNDPTHGWDCSIDTSLLSTE